MQEVPRAHDVQTEGGAEVHRVRERQGVHEGGAEADDKTTQQTQEEGTVPIG